MCQIGPPKKPALVEWEIWLYMSWFSCLYMRSNIHCPRIGKRDSKKMMSTLCWLEWAMLHPSHSLQTHMWSPTCLHNIAMGQVVISLSGLHTISNATPTLAHLMDMSYDNLHILKGFLMWGARKIPHYTQLTIEPKVTIAMAMTIFSPTSRKHTHESLVIIFINKLKKNMCFVHYLASMHTFIHMWLIPISMLDIMYYVHNIILPPCGILWGYESGWVC